MSNTIKQVVRNAEAEGLTQSAEGDSVEQSATSVKVKMNIEQRHTQGEGISVKDVGRAKGRTAVMLLAILGLAGIVASLIGMQQ